MKLLIVLAFCIAAALAVPSEVEILKNVYENIGAGYKFGFEQSDGQAREEFAELKNVGTETEAISVKGSFSFIGDDGQTYTVTYIADENGFQPSAAHLPVAPIA
ncbi:unnamed protein product [Diamesa tonsa]